MTTRRPPFVAIPDGARALTMCACLLLAPSSSRAQTRPADAEPALTEQARRLFLQGLDALDRDRLVDAAQLFERSYRLRPAAVVLVNLAVVLRSQGRFLEAQTVFRRAIDEGASELLPDEMIRARNDLARLELAIPVVRVTGLPPRAEVRADGRVATVIDGECTLRLDPGTHTIAVTAAGFEPEQRSVRAESSAQQTIELRMRRSPQPRLWVSLPPMRDAVDVTVDGERWPYVNRRRAVLAGTHRVRVTAPGYLPMDRTVMIPDRTTVRVDVALVRARSNTVAWVVGALSAAVVVTTVGVATGLAASPEPLPRGLWDGPISTPMGAP